MLRPEDVANGDRERTLALLWELAVHFQVLETLLLSFLSLR